MSQSNTPMTPVSTSALWVGRVASAIPVLMLLMAGVMKLLKPPAVLEGFAQLGWPERYALGLGILEIACAVVYLIPRTAFVGAILMTGYLGGAIATHVRIGELVIIPQVALIVLVWLGLYLRDVRVRALVGPTSS